MARTRTIVGIGGRPTAATPGPSRLDEYILELAGVDRPKVLFLPTAAADADAQIVAFYERFATAGNASHLKLTGAPDRADWRPRLQQQDVIWVSGGNTANALAIWRAHGVDAALREAWEKGTVMCGSSAGMICWFECSVSDSFGPRLAALRDGLGFLPGSACPHYDTEPARRPTYRDLVASGFPGGYAADDLVGMRFEGTALKEAVCEAAGRQAYRVELAGGAVRETALPTRLLARHLA